MDSLTPHLVLLQHCEFPKHVFVLKLHVLAYKQSLSDVQVIGSDSEHEGEQSSPESPVQYPLGPKVQLVTRHVLVPLQSESYLHSDGSVLLHCEL